MGDRIFEAKQKSQRFESPPQPKRFDRTPKPQETPPQFDILARTGARTQISATAKTHANTIHRLQAARSPLARQALQQLQRQYGNRYVQRVVELARQGEGHTEVAPEIEAAIERQRGGGQALDNGVRGQMESAFGVDFSRVNIHADNASDLLNRSLEARAFTVGSDIFFRQGEYAPGSTSGKELLAHELTHVVQQTGGVQSKLTVSQPGDRYEREADRIAKAIVQSPPIQQESIEREMSDSIAAQADEWRIQRSCACGGSCPSCTSERDIQQKLQTERDISSLDGSNEALHPVMFPTSLGGYEAGTPLNLDGVPGSSIADPLFVAIDGPPPPEITVRPSMTAPSISRQPIPPPNSIRVVQNHQFPITATHVAAGWRSGFGGVAEMEVSNGTTNYNGSHVSEHFIGGFGNNQQIGGCNNRSGQGGQGGSTFTVGTGVNFSQNGLNINFPPKHNRFYDLHIKGFGTNILPAGTNFQFSLCIQRYSFRGSTIFGRFGGLLPAVFARWHGIKRANVGGQDVATINLVKF